jgi:hypothetical protein
VVPPLKKKSVLRHALQARGEKIVPASPLSTTSLPWERAGIDVEGVGATGVHGHVVVVAARAG